MKRKRIVIVHNWKAHGINIQSMQLARALSGFYDVWFLTAARIDVSQKKENDHLTIIQWPNKRPVTLKDLWFCCNFFRKIKPAIIMAHFTGIRLSMFAGWIAGVKKRVAWYHIVWRGLLKNVEDAESEKWMLRKYKAGFLFATHIVAFSEYGKKDAVSFLKINPEKVSVIPNGMLMPHEFKPSLYSDTKELFFLFLGRMHSSKGGDFIIKCFQEISKQNHEVKLKLVGFGEEEQEWKDMVKTLNLDQTVLMPGSASSFNQVFDYLKQAYVLLVPSRVDNFPNVILEAMSCGVPVIASAVGGIPEMIEDGVDGFLCDPYDENAWIDKIKTLIETKTLRNRMSLAAYDNYKKKYHIDQHVKNVKDFIEKNI